MPRGDKSTYTIKQKRQAEHIEEDYEKSGVPKKEAQGRAWATVNKETGGGNQSGSSRAKEPAFTPSKKAASKTPVRSRTAAERSASAKKAAQTRARNARSGS